MWATRPLTRFRNCIYTDCNYKTFHVERFVQVYLYVLIYMAMRTKREYSRRRGGHKRRTTGEQNNLYRTAMYVHAAQAQHT